MINLAYVIAVAICIGLLIFLFQALRRLTGTEETSRHQLWRRRLRVAVALVLLAGFMCGVWVFLIEPNRLVVNQQAIQINNWPNDLKGIRLGVIGDIHAGAPFIDDLKLRLLVERTNQQQPDLVVLLGDFMSQDTWHGHRVAPEIIANHLKYLQAPLGVYAVLGNHDWWDNGDEVRRALEQAGIRVLENDVSEVKRGGTSFWLAGLADIWTRPQQVPETLAKIPSGSLIIALTHNPDVFQRLPRTVPLLLAAHTHGGQVNFPLIGTPVVPSRFGQKYSAGHVFENDHHLFVTTGIGTSILPVRFRVPPEIVVLTIESK
ncbi:MAG TPA: metallophosphoesterase [Pyrinomonadaceae bacterium]